MRRFSRRVRRVLPTRPVQRLRDFEFYITRPGRRRRNITDLHFTQDYSDGGGGRRGTRGRPVRALSFFRSDGRVGLRADRLAAHGTHRCGPEFFDDAGLRDGRRRFCFSGRFSSAADRGDAARLGAGRLVHPGALDGGSRADAVVARRAARR